MHNLDLLAKKFNVAIVKYCDTYEIVKNDDWVIMKLQEEVGELFQAWLMHTGRARDKGQSPEQLKEMMANEITDVFGMIMTFASTQGVDLNKYIEKKWKFNVEEN